LSPSRFDAAPYAQIVRSLFPRTQRVMLYGDDGRLLWSEDGADSLDLRALLERVIATARTKGNEAALKLARESGGPLGRLLPLLQVEAAADGWLGVIGAGSHAVGEASGEVLEQSLRPVLQLLARDVTNSAQLRRQRIASLQAAEETAELRWLLATASPAAEAPNSDRLEATLRTCVEHIGCEGAVLWLESRGIERVVLQRDLPAEETETLRRIARGPLGREVAVRGRTVIVNRLRETPEAGLLPWTVIATPVPAGSQDGSLVMLFARRETRRIGARDARRLEQIVPRLLAATQLELDPLTGLPARHVFEERLRAALAKPGTTGCVVYADLDQLHVTNDLFGFAAGDDVLRRVAQLWHSHGPLRVEVAGRFAGDRFVALLPDCTLNQGRAWAESMRIAIEAMPPPPHSAGLRVTASLGVAAAVAGEAAEHLLVTAETACKAAKDRGRNRVEVFSPSDASLMQRQDDLAIFRELLDALEQNRFDLYAQPIVPLWDPTRTRRYEILVRMRDTEGRPVSPARFISAATRYQLLPQLDRWILRRAIASLEPHTEALKARNAAFSINVSGQSIEQADFADYVRTALKASSFPPELLYFEFTESAAIADIGAAKRFIERVGALGAGFALDDFGTGFSSLAYLKSLPVSTLKIDGSFVRDLLTDARSEGLVRAVLQIASQLGLDTVAEYVETQAIAERLSALGVTYGQGYAFGAPVPLESVLAELTAVAASPSPAQ
jgi:diguanylate cyclase (GGDEF)-like protein